jgi:steroid delta-isomerase-like uncharacterized protein
MKKYLFTLIAISLMAGASCQQKTDSDKEMKALADKELEVWNGGSLSLYDDILSSNLVFHGPDAIDIIGIDAYKENVTFIRTSFPDFKVTLNELIITGDKGVVRWTMTGTNTGPFGELPPTGKKMSVSGVNIIHVVDGKISEEWQFYNQALFYTQLGFTITPPEQ